MAGGFPYLRDPKMEIIDNVGTLLGDARGLKAQLARLTKS